MSIISPTISPGVPRSRSLAKAIDLLQAVALARTGVSASALSRSTGLPRATVTRLLRTLADAGLVHEPTGAGWVLGYELVRLARAADPHGQVVAASRMPLERLRSRSGESALVAVPVGPTEMEIVVQLDADHLVSVAGWVGRTLPLYASSAGKLMLAELDDSELDAWLDSSQRVALTHATIVDTTALRTELRRVRQRGFADLIDELEDGLVSLSAPVREADGRLAAMIGVSGPTFRLGGARRRELVRPVLAAAEETARALAVTAG